MDDVLKIFKVFSELRDRYSDIETAIEAVCISTKLDQEEVIGVLITSGAYVLPDSEEERAIRNFISSADMTKTNVNELIGKVGFYYCISDREAKRLVEKCLTENIH